MKKGYLYIPFIAAGVAVGYFNASIDKLDRWNLFLEMLFGGGLGWILGIAFFEKQYPVFLGAVSSLVVSAALDLLAGSSITVRDKLGDMFFGAFLGWYFPIFLKQMLIGGFIGGIIGFVWGMIHSHRIGNVGFASGDGAILLAIAWFVLGMGIGKLYMMSFGYRFLKNPT